MTHGMEFGPEHRATQLVPEATSHVETTTDFVTDEINQRAAEIKDQEEFARKQAERLADEQEAKRQLALAEAGREVQLKEELSERFISWAVSNDIPYDATLAGEDGPDTRTKLKLLTDRMLGALPDSSNRNQPPYRGWRIATKHKSVDNREDHGKNPVYPYYLAVDRSGSFFYSDPHNIFKWAGEFASEEVMGLRTTPLGRFSLNQIKEGIATQVAKHNRLW